MSRSVGGGFISAAKDQKVSVARRKKEEDVLGSLSFHRVIDDRGWIIHLEWGTFIWRGSVFAVMDRYNASATCVLCVL